MTVMQSHSTSQHKKAECVRHGGQGSWALLTRPWCPCTGCLGRICSLYISMWSTEMKLSVVGVQGI